MQTKKTTKILGTQYQQMQQLFIDCYDCKGPLNDSDLLIESMKSASQAVGAKILESHGCHYQPHGITAIVFLAESHILVTTWPEFNYATVEIFLCNPEMDTHDIWDDLKQVIQPATQKQQTIFHTVPFTLS